MHRTMRYAGRLVAAVSCILASAGCAGSTSSDGEAALVVVTSTNVWGDIAATIGGARVDVTSFISSPGQDPHSFESSSRNILAVSKADVVIENGGGYDDFIGRLLDASNGDPTVLDAVEISGLDAPAGGSLNEHVWYDLATVQTVSTRIAMAFSEADPAHAELYRKNAKTFTASVDALRDREADIKTRVAGVGVGITEPVPLYMLDAVGAVNKTPEQFSAAVEEGEDVAVAVLAATLRLYSEHRVAALVYNEQTSGPVTEQVRQAAQDAKIAVVPMTETLPDGADYLSWMGDNLDRLDIALRRP